MIMNNFILFYSFAPTTAMQAAEERRRKSQQHLDHNRNVIQVHQTLTVNK